MNKPKGKIPSLLAQSTGKPAAHLCKRKSSCTRCKTHIIMNDNCFTIPKSTAGFTSHKPFCLECVKLIIDQTKKELSEIDDQLTAFYSNEK